MTHIQNSRRILIAATAILMAAVTAPAVGAQQPEPVGDSYAAGDYGRVRYQINGLTIRRSGLTYEGAADINSPVFPGDSIVTGPDQRAEVELAGGDVIRIDRNSEVTFLAMPSPYASFQDNVVLQVSKGFLRVNARIGTDEEFRIDTPDTSVYLLGDGDFRIDVPGDGATRAVSRRGVAEVGSAGGSVLIRGGMRTTVVNGGLPDNPEPFNTFGADNFDRWVAERQSADRHDETSGQFEAHDGAYDALPSEVRPYYGELSESGSWTNSDEYGYVWSPRHVPSGWRPYNDGYWEYGPGGYFWVSAEPWGWAPYHYGRWVWGASFGWGWTPGRVFGGAWVAWSWGSAYIGWAPLGYYNYPVYYGNYYYGYYDPHCWTFAGYGNFYYRGYHPHGGHGYHSSDQIGDHVATNAVRTRPPAVSPDELSHSPESRAKALRTVTADTDAAIPPLSASATNRESFGSTEHRQRTRLTDNRLRQTSTTAPTARTIPTTQFDSSLGRPESSAFTASPSSTATRIFANYPRRIQQDTVTPSRTFRRPAPQPGTDRSRDRVAPDSRARTSPPEYRRPPLPDRRETTYRRSPSSVPAQPRESSATPAPEQRSKSLGNRIRTLFKSSERKKSSTPSSSSASKPSTSRSKPSTSKAPTSRSKPSTSRSKSSSPSRSRRESS